MPRILNELNDKYVHRQIGEVSGQSRMFSYNSRKYSACCPANKYHGNERVIFFGYTGHVCCFTVTDI
jgi:hypothetical protein